MRSGTTRSCRSRRPTPPSRRRRVRGDAMNTRPQASMAASTRPSACSQTPSPYSTADWLGHRRASPTSRFLACAKRAWATSSRAAESSARKRQASSAYHPPQARTPDPTSQASQAHRRCDRAHPGGTKIVGWIRHADHTGPGGSSSSESRPLARRGGSGSGSIADDGAEQHVIKGHRSVRIAAEHLFTLARGQGEPGPLGDRVLDESDRAVGHVGRSRRPGGWNGPRRNRCRCPRRPIRSSRGPCCWG